jgi:hypothetical protein
MRRALLIAGLVIVLALLLPVVIGALLPRGHVAGSRAIYRVPPEELWAIVSDLERWPSWNSAVERVERLPDREGRPAWKATGAFGEMPTLVETWEPPRRIVTRIPEDAGLGFHGSWTYEIAPAEGGASLTITERGEVANPVFRFFSLFMDLRTSIDRFLVDLGRSLGQPVEPEPLPQASPTAPGRVP